MVIASVEPATDHLQKDALAMTRTHLVAAPENTPCPLWCEQVQCREAEPVDRFHQAEAPLALVLRHFDVATNHAYAVPADATVVLFTRATEPDETWLAIEVGDDGSAGLTISLESARRLQRVLAELLRQTGAPR